MPYPLAGVWFWWARLFFENCTVDASISGEVTAPLFFCGVVVSSAICCDRFVCSSFLGHTEDALASGADEGRGSLRYASGSRQPDFDPGISEWGNLAPVMGCRRRLNV